MNYLDDDLKATLALNEVHTDIAQKRATTMMETSLSLYSTIANPIAQAILASTHALLTQQEYSEGHPQGINRRIATSLQDTAAKLSNIAEATNLRAASCLNQGSIK